MSEIYEIISEVFNMKDISFELEKNYQFILEIIKQENFKTKTELLKYLIQEQISAYEKIKIEGKLKLSTNNLINLIYLKIYIDCILQINNDIINFVPLYDLTKLFGKINEDLHPYLVMILKINIKLEQEIKNIYYNLESMNNKEIFPVTVKYIENLLNSYKNDNTNWNKI